MHRSRSDSLWSSTHGLMFNANLTILLINSVFSSRYPTSLNSLTPACGPSLLHWLFSWCDKILGKQERRVLFLVTGEGDMFHHTREGMVVRFGGQLVTSHLQSGSREWAGSEVRLETVKSCHYRPIFSIKSLPPEGSTTFLNSTRN